MRKRTLKRRPAVEVLESLELLSGAWTPSLDIAPTRLVGDLTHTKVSLNATTQGTYTWTVFNPDAGAQYQFSTSGFAAGIGLVTVTGTLNTTGFIGQGYEGGTLTVTTPQGTLTLQATSDLVPGFAPLARTFHFAVTSGTGAYAHNPKGVGTIDVTVLSEGPISTQRLPITSQGTIRLVFKS